jgi:hypothetical protein
MRCGELNSKGYDISPELSQTINLNNSMSTSEIQAAINGVGRYIGPGQELIFQFADGTYNMTDELKFEGFYGGGYMRIYGNTGESGLHTDQAVYLDFNSAGSYGIRMYRISIPVYVQNLKIRVDASSWTSGIYASTNLYTVARWNYVYSASTASGAAISIVRGGGSELRQNYVGGHYIGINATLQAHVCSWLNDDTGTSPQYGLHADYGSTIGKFDANQPTGSVANETASSGAEIR